MRSRLLAFALALTGCTSSSTATTAGVDAARFAQRVVAFTPGDDAGFGADALPGVVLGPPRGGGEKAGSLDVVALGHGGSIVVELGAPVVDGPGADFIVFENPFLFGEGLLFLEPGFVAVSDDGETFFDFACDPEAELPVGCAGLLPVVADAAADWWAEPDPDATGGDAFDLAEVGLAEARFVRITDAGVGLGQAPSAGFDLDAVAAIHLAP